MNQSLEEAVDKYTAAWNEKDAGKIHSLLSECFETEGTYIDRNNPLIRSVSEITRLILESYKLLPERQFSLAAPPECHNNSGRFFWILKLPENIERQGMDYFEYNDKNQITRIVGFV